MTNLTKWLMAVRDRDVNAAVLAEREQHTLTLRDQFAMAALTGMMATRKGSMPTFHPSEDAEYVYQVADAMIKARDNA